MAGADRRATVRTLLKRLDQSYPDAKCSLNYRTPLELLVATILSAQCTDERVNQVTPTLFARFPDARAFAEAAISDLEDQVRSTGFFRNKAKHIQGACRRIVDHFGGAVPRTMDELLTLPGVARKTANVVLGNAFEIAAGVVVDTHVHRLSQRLGLSERRQPEQVEQDLMACLPQSAWIRFSHQMILHGRGTCLARSPRCAECVLASGCPRVGVEPAPAVAAHKPRRRAKGD